MWGDGGGSSLDGPVRVSVRSASSVSRAGARCSVIPRPRNLVAVRSMRRDDHGARGYLTRLVAVLAVLAGLVMLLSPRCADGMIADTPMAAGSSADMTAHPATGTHPTMDMTMPMTTDDGGSDVVSGPSTATATAEHSGSSRGMGGALAACLAFLVAALVASVRLARPDRSGIGVAPRPSMRVLVDCLVPAARPDRATLCVLRI